MTGAYLRVKRNDKWTNIEVEYLTDEERFKLFKDRPRQEIIRWLDHVCKTLVEYENDMRDLGMEMDLLT